MKRVDLPPRQCSTSSNPSPLSVRAQGYFNTASTLFAVVLLLSSTAIEAKIYKWIDSDGITQYTQSPPPEDVSSEEIPTQTYDAEAAAQSKQALQKRIDALNQRRDDKKQAKNKDEKTSEEQKEREKYCEVAKQRLAEFQTGRPLAQEQADGSFVRMTEEQLAAQIATVQEKITELCN